MQIPNLRPVFVREQTNKMYSPTAYFISGWLSSTIFLFFYPLITSSISFYFLKFKNDSFEHYLRWLGIFFI